jgi:putative restriction endonuclease
MPPRVELLVALRATERRVRTFGGVSTMANGNFGDIPGLSSGDVFPDRAALHAAGVHRPTQAGIAGRGAEGAESIVLNEGYEDDEDLGDEIIYTGEGGRDPNSWCADR